MATEEVKKILINEEVTVKRVEFFASTLDAFFQDFLEKSKANDRLGSIVACARLAQLAHGMYEEYAANTAAIIDSDTEVKVAQQACTLVGKMMDDNARGLGFTCAADGTIVPEESKEKNMSN